MGQTCVTGWEGYVIAAASDVRCTTTGLCRFFLWAHIEVIRNLIMRLCSGISDDIYMEWIWKWDL